MKRHWMWPVRVSIAAAIIAGTVWVLRPRPIIVEIARVELGALEATVTAEGKTRVRDLFVVAAPVDGELERMSLKAGDAVTASSVIARILPVSPRPLDARSRAEAVAAVAVARAAVQKAEATQKEAIAALAHAESTSQTSVRLAKEGAAAANEAQHAGHEVEIRRQAASASNFALEEARAALVRAEAAATTFSSPSGRAITDVRSPSAGRVLRIVRESGGPVAAGAALVELGNVNDIEVIADFLTTDAMAVEPGAKASISDWGGDEPLPARVRRVEPGAFTKVSALGLEEQRVRIVLDLTSAAPKPFGNDFHVNVSVVVWKGANVITVPSTALFRVGEEWAVFLVRDGRAQLTTVAIGRSDGMRTVIEHGLDRGDEVIVQPSDTVRDGARVAASRGTQPTTVRKM